MARLGIKASELSAVVLPSRPSLAMGKEAGGLASSPRGSAASDNTMLTRMRAVLKRHQCGTEEEAVSTCLRAQTSQQSVMAAGAPCSGYINSLRYCQLQTQQHNYPVAPAFLY